LMRISDRCDCSVMPVGPSSSEIRRLGPARELERQLGGSGGQHGLQSEAVFKHVKVFRDRSRGLYARGYGRSMPTLRGLDQPLEAALSIFEVLLRVVEALENLFVAFCAEFLTAIDSVFDDFGHFVYPICHP